MTAESPTTTDNRRKRRMKRKIAAVAAGLVSVSSAAGATVLVQNFMRADFNAAPPCLAKVAGTDTDGVNDFSTWNFSAAGTIADPDSGLALTEEALTIEGLIGDRVQANDVFVIQNDCGIDMDVQLASGAQTGTWTNEYLALYLQADPNTATTGYPLSGTGWDADPLEFDASATDTTSGTVTVGDGESITVGVVATVAAAQVGAGDAEATWIVEAEG